MRSTGRATRLCGEDGIFIYIYIYIGLTLHGGGGGSGASHSASPGKQILALTLLDIHTLPGGPLPLLCSRAHAGVVLPHPDALVRALCPVALRAGLLRAAWRTALSAWRWRKAGSFLPHSSYVSQKENSRNCVWVAGGLSPCECVY